MTPREYEQRFNTILNLSKSPNEKDELLAILMTEMERAFQIPMIKNKAWEEENIEVYALYRKVSESRSF